VNDFERCLNVLLEGDIEFVIIGGVAMYAHGSAQLTRDLDICYERTHENIKRLAAALSPYQPRLRGVPDDLPFHLDASTITRGTNFTLTTKLGDLGLIGEVAGLGQYHQVRASSITLELFGRSCKVLSLDGLIEAKRATGRSRDTAAMAQLEALRELASHSIGAAGERASPSQEMAAFPARVMTERNGPLARLVINRPPLNILDLDTIHELNSRLTGALKEEGVRLVEIRSAGEKAFSAGVDIRDHLPDRAPEMLREFHSLIRAVLYAPCPVLAVVRGHCLGGGMELALACDFIVASDDARFGQPEIKVGAFPPVAAVLLSRLIPEKKALELILTGELSSAEEAQRLGLVNRVVRAAELEDAVARFSGLLLAPSAQVTMLARKAARLTRHGGTLESALRESERIYLEHLLSTEDASEGLRAFLEKRSPVWTK
jgi:cyclohexa-1,5-dienecarbonyl-CoA hydratase